MLYRSFKKIRSVIEDRIHRIDPRPVLPAEDFPWAEKVEAYFPSIRRELEPLIMPALIRSR